MSMYLDTFLTFSLFQIALVEMFPIAMKLIASHIFKSNKDQCLKKYYLLESFQYIFMTFLLIDSNGMRL